MKPYERRVMRLGVMLLAGSLLAGTGWKIGTKCGDALSEGWPEIIQAMKERWQYKKMFDPA